MKYYEKAIANYANERRKFHEQELKREIARYNESIEYMMSTGSCIIVDCEYCPLFQLPNPNQYVRCETIAKDKKRKLIAMEVDYDD